jgi:phosphohistidine phosphatase
MDLYLVRHGVAYDPDPTRWPDDTQRPLTPEGEKRFLKAARGLGRVVDDVELVLSSPWPRAWRTAELLAKGAGWPKPEASEALESGRTPTEVLQALQPHSGIAAVALVGHEPSLHELASYLLTAERGHVQLEMKKGGVARLWLDENLRPGGARLRWLLTARVLRALDS